MLDLKNQKPKVSELSSGYPELSSDHPKLILHVCCIGCGVYVSKLLEKEYSVVLYFYNPGIYPKEEYLKRLEETKRVALKYDLTIIEGKYKHDDWLKKVKGHEKEPERGQRCLICYRDRLENTALTAKEQDAEYFTTTLTVSPHKESKAIFEIGTELSKIYGINFLDIDFKKKDGFKKTMQLSRHLELYRQNYCGCEFSVR